MLQIQESTKNPQHLGNKIHGRLMFEASVFLHFFLYCSFVFQIAVSIQSVHITALVNPNSRIGREQKVAIELAAHGFNSSVSSLFLNISDITSGVVEDRGADVLIAAGQWPEVVHVTEELSKKRIPVLSLATTQPLTLAPNPFLFRMSYSVSSYVRCLADIVKSHNWRRVIVIYEEDKYGSISGSITPLLSNALQAVGSDIDYHADFPPLLSLPEPNSTINSKLERIKRRLCKVFILLRWSSPSLSVDLFKAAKALGMMDKGNVWITGDDITTLVDSTFTPSFISSYMQGVIGIRTYYNKSTKSYNDFNTEFRQRFESEYSKIEETNFDPGMYALRAYDAIDVIARAMARDSSRSEGLLEGIQSANFPGLSGPIQFKRDGRLMNHKGSSAFQLINFVGQSYREMGFWVNEFGFFAGELEMDRGELLSDSLNPVYWPGGPSKIPGGWGRLRIGVPGRTAFDKFVKVEYDEHDKRKVKNVTGFCIDVFNEILKWLKYDLSYDFLPFNGTYDQLISGVPKTYDAVVGDITTLANRLEKASFTAPFLPSGLSRMVRTKPNHKAWMLTKPFSNEVWYLIAASLIYTGLVVWYLEHKQNPEFNGPWWSQFGATFWLISSTIFFKHGRIYSYYTKIVIVAWLVVVLVLTNTYTASLSSILTSHKLEPVANDGKVGCDGDSFVLKYLQEVLGYRNETITKIGAEGDYLSAFDSGNITAAYLEVPYMRVFLAENKGYTPYGEIHRLGGFGFVFPKSSPLTADFSQIISQLSENGILKQLEDKWFAFTITSCPSMLNYENGDSLNLGSFWALFAFTIVTTTVILLLSKARFLPAYSRSAWTKGGIHLRGRYMKLRSKIRRRKVPQLSRRCSFPSPQVAPELDEAPTVVSENHPTDSSSVQEIA